MDIIKNRYIFIIFSGILVVLSLLLIGFLGLRQGIDLKGGTQWQVSFTDALIGEQSIIRVLRDTNSNLDIFVTRAGDNSFIIRLPDIDAATHELYSKALVSLGPFSESNFSSIGPAIGAELRQKAIWAVVVTLLAISFYITWAFRKVSQPIKSWKYGIVTLVTLFHDVIIPAGLLALFGRLKGIEIDTNFIVALLVVMGFSVHDTIVVFDRIRENLLINRGRSIDLAQIINHSIRETFVRSINTSFTLILVLLTLIFAGPPSLFYFILTILVGTTFGTYSSIFVASPILYMWGRTKRYTG